MDGSSTGAFIMVKYILTIILLASINAHAGYYAGMQNNSWQDVIPVSYTDTGTGQKVTFYALTTFSTLSAGGGNEGQYLTRWRYTADMYIHTGTADIHKIQGTVAPRKSITSQWASFKLAYRLSKTFAMGPMLIVNSVQVPDTGGSTSLGLMINSDIEMYDNLRFIQNFGTMNDSGTISYTVGIQKFF